MVAPVAAFSGTPLTGTAPVTVTFTDASTNTPTSWAWDFGDGITATTQSPTHEYVQSGSYTVVLTATNADGSDAETKVAYVVVTGSTLSLVMDGLAALVTTYDNVYAYPAKSIVVPAVVVGYPTRIEFDLTFQGSGTSQTHNTYLIPVYLLVADAAGKGARDALSNAITGATGIKALLDGNHAFGATRVIDVEVQQVKVNDVTFIGLQFDTETLT